MSTFRGCLVKPGVGEHQADLWLVWVLVVVVGEHRAVSRAGAKVLAGLFTLDFGCCINIVISVDGALVRDTARAIFYAGAFDVYVPCNTTLRMNLQRWSQVLHACTCLFDASVLSFCV